MTSLLSFNKNNFILILTVAAKSDLQSIARYTLNQWGVTQKQHYLGLINKSLKALLLSCQGENIISMGKARPELSLKPIGNDLIYSYTIKEHHVYYRMVSYQTNKKEIIIVRILHTRMEAAHRIKG